MKTREEWERYHRNWCSQCGHRLMFKPCGPTHAAGWAALQAIRRAELRLQKRKAKEGR